MKIIRKICAPVYLIILVSCGAWLWSQTTVLNAMTVGDETAATLGIKVAQFRLQVFFVCALITRGNGSFFGNDRFCWSYDPTSRSHDGRR